MKKTFTINISGSIFHIEEDAYEMLQNYLLNLKNHFGAGEAEVIVDIEARIAEIFNSKITEANKVVTEEMVAEVIKIMGTPEDFAQEEGEDGESEFSASETKCKRRLYRDPDNSVLGGVCSGVGAYFNIDTVVIRVIFLLLFFSYSVGFWAYIILWIAVPKAATIAQRLEMRGQEANVQNIKKSAREESGETTSKKKTNVSRVNPLDDVFRVLVRVFAVFVGIVLTFSGFFGLFGLISTAIVGQSFVAGWPLVWSPEIHALDIFGYLVDPETFTLGLFLICVIVGMPLLAMLYVGSKLIFRYKSNNTAIVVGMAGIWLIALLLLLSASVSKIHDFSTRTSVNNNEIVDCGKCRTLYLQMAENRYERSSETGWDIDGFKVFRINGENIFAEEPRLDIERSATNDFVINIKYVSSGKNRDEGRTNCRGIDYSYTLSDSTFVFSPYFFLKRSHKWRKQKVYVTLKVPEGKSVYIGDGMEAILHDVENVSNTWTGDMPGKYWEMRPEGLTEVK